MSPTVKYFPGAEEHSTLTVSALEKHPGMRAGAADQEEVPLHMHTDAHAHAATTIQRHSRGRISRRVSDHRADRATNADRS